MERVLALAWEQVQVRVMELELVVDLASPEQD